MNSASRWRLELGRQLGMAYAANPKAKVVMVAGSTAAGTADRYSDLELDVYWNAPPTDQERVAAAEGGGGTLVDLWPYEEDEWAETISVGGFQVGTSTFLVTTMERYLAEVIDHASTQPLPQVRLWSLLHARPLVGEELVARWRAKAAAYPPALVHAMLREHLGFEPFGDAEDLLAARGDLLVLYDGFCRVERQLLGALLGLNRLYLPNPSFKGMDTMIAAMALAPPNLAARLKDAFHVPAPDGVRVLHALIDEVFALVELHLPEFDTGPYRDRVRERRGVWEHSPR
jgi:hypothetical protein